jgi:hypothetical protein
MIVTSPASIFFFSSSFFSILSGFYVVFGRYLSPVFFFFCTFLYFLHLVGIGARATVFVCSMDATKVPVETVVRVCHALTWIHNSHSACERGGFFHFLKGGVSVVVDINVSTAFRHVVL